MDEEELVLSVAEAARLTGVSPYALRDMIHDGRLRGSFLVREGRGNPRGSYRIPVASLVASGLTEPSEPSEPSEPRWTMRELRRRLTKLEAELAEAKHQIALLIDANESLRRELGD